MKRSLVVRSLLGIAVICSLKVHPHLSAAPALDSLSWVPVAAGVNYTMADSGVGNGIFVGIGGWSATQAMVDSWVTALYAAKLRVLGVRHLYSVKGPNDEGYISHEIGTLALARHLLLLMHSRSAINRIIVAAHSSGAYVAHALFHDLYDGMTSIDTSHTTDGKILYFLLDEAIGTVSNAVELRNTAAERLGHIYGVYAYLPSQNLYSYAPQQMIALGNRYGSLSSSLMIDASGSGCTAMLCMHMTLINQKPYQKAWYDWRDYGVIDPDHPVQTAYLDVLTALSYRSLQPMEFLLWQNYPNPFNPSTTIRYRLPHRSHVTLAVFTALGQKVAELVNGDVDAGYHIVQFNASNLSSGVYFYRLQARSYTETRKLVLMK